MRLDTKAKREASRQAEIDHCVEKMDAKVQHVYDLIIVTYERKFRENSHAPCCRIWRGSGGHSIEHAYYSSPERRQAVIDSHIQAAEDRVARKAKNKREKKEFKSSLIVGSILYTSWGYDQTNVDFFQVIEAKGHFVIVRQICAERVDGSMGHDSCKLMPIKDQFSDRSEPLRRKVSAGNNIRISSCETGYLWDGKARYCSWGH